MIAVQKLDGAIGAIDGDGAPSASDATRSLSSSIELTLGEECQDMLGNYLSNRLPAIVWETLGGPIWSGIQVHFDSPERDRAYHWIWPALAQSLYVTIADCLAGDVERRRPLLDLWLDGHWPLGFTRDKSLVVFTARSAPD